MPVQFPKVTLEQAMRVPEALQRNGGQPLAKIDMATALDISPGSSYLRTWGSASSAYGLTAGSHQSEFTMKELGTRIFAPTSPEDRTSALVEAALLPDAFRRVFDFYKGRKFPEVQFFVNTLVREFDVAESQAPQFAEIFTSNMRLVGLVRGTTSGDWLSDGLPTAAVVASSGEVTVQSPQIPDSAATARRPGVLDKTPEGDDEEIGIPGSVHDRESEPAVPKRPNKLFVGHGRNKKPLEQLTKTLRDFGIPHIVAEDEPNSGRPISQKVRDTMNQCGAAILIFSADVEYFDEDGKSVWRPSENVDHELGAAAVMYDDRVILFKEDSISLASNFSGIGYIPFEKDKLDAKTNDLLRELIAFKILKVSVD